MYQTLQYREDGAVATIQLNRPQKKNSFNAEMRKEMETLLHELARKPGIRAVVITGGDEIFCAGADISEIEGTASAEAAYQHAREFQILFDQVESLPQPVIAAVSGWALGGGCELALAAIFASLPRPLALVCRKSRSAPFPAAADAKTVAFDRHRQSERNDSHRRSDHGAGSARIRLSHDGSRERAINGVSAATCGEARGAAPPRVAGVEDADQPEPGSRLGDRA